MKYGNKTENYTDFFYHFFRNILIISLPLVVISVFILSVPRSSADNSAADNVSFEIPSSCTLNATVNEDHKATTISGQYIKNVGATTLKTICNDSNGFSIYAIGASDNTEGNTKLTSNVSAQYDIETGIAESGNISNWAMKLAPVTGTYTPTMVEGYDNVYTTVPSSWTKVAFKPSNTDVSTDSNVAGSSITTTYAMYASPAQPAGTYNGQVKYLIIHPSGGPANLTSLEDVLNTAVGVEHKTTYKGKQYYKMQDMTKAICDTANVIGSGSQIQLLDDRTNLDGDKRLYWVAKLDDGNCWMTQNLDLDLIANHTYTHADTDLGWDPTSPDVNATWTVGSSYGTIAWDSANNKFTGWVGSNILPSSGDPEEKYYYTSNTTGNDTTFDAIAQCLTTGHSQTNCEHYSAGNYYNFTAAIASNDSTSLTSGNAPNSICPAGWRLPNNLADEYAQLLVSYNIIASISGTSYMVGGFNAIRSAPLYFVRSGVINNAGSRSEPDLGLYWSKTVSKALRIASNGIRSANNESRASGWSIRCLTR